MSKQSGSRRGAFGRVMSIVSIIILVAVFLLIKNDLEKRNARNAAKQDARRATSTALAARTPTPLPPPKAIPFAEAAAHEGQRVMVQGNLPKSVARITCRETTQDCWLPLESSPEGATRLLIKVPVTERATAANSMSPLPRGFQTSDLKIRADDLKLVQQGDRLRVTGWVRLADDQLSGMPEGTPIILGSGVCIGCPLSGFAIERLP